MYAFCLERQTRLDDQPFAIEVVEDVELPEATPVRQLIMPEVHRPRRDGGPDGGSTAH